MKKNILARYAFIYLICIAVLFALFDFQRFQVYLDRKSSENAFISSINEGFQNFLAWSQMDTVSAHIDDIFDYYSEPLVINAYAGENQNNSKGLEEKNGLWNAVQSHYFNSERKQAFYAERENERQENQGDGDTLASSESLKNTEEIKSSAIAKALTEAEQSQEGKAFSSQNSSKISSSVNSLISENSSFSENSLKNSSLSVNASHKKVLFNENLVHKAKSSEALDEYSAHIPDFSEKIRVLIIGDSMMMEGLGPELQKALHARGDVDVTRKGRYSSGLSRPDFYDWPQNMQNFLEQYDPQLVIMSLGANDTQDIVIDKKRYFIDTKEWEEVYEKRATDFLALASQGGRHVLWASLPIMSMKKYYGRVKVVSRLQASAVQKYENTEFVDTTHLLTKDGKYTAFMVDKNNKSVRLRSKDGIHVSAAGGKIMTDYLEPYIQKQLDAIRYKDFGKELWIPVPHKANKVKFHSSILNKDMEYYVFLPKNKDLEGKNSASLNSETGKGNQSKINSQERSQNNQNTEKAQNSSKNSDKSENTGLKSQISSVIGSDKLYPVIYLLHGENESGAIWNEKLGKELQAFADKEQLIFVALSTPPQGWYLDNTKTGNIQSYLKKELIPHIDTVYPSNKKRGILGVSMGGHGATLFAYKNQDSIESVASVSGILDIRLHEKDWNLTEILGSMEQNKKTWREASFIGNLAYLRMSKHPQVLLLTGKEDAISLNDHREAKDVFAHRKMPISYQEVEGGRGWDLWQKYIPSLLKEQAQYLNKE